MENSMIKKVFQVLKNQKVKISLKAKLMFQPVKSIVNYHNKITQVSTIMIKILSMEILHKEIHLLQMKMLPMSSKKIICILLMFKFNLIRWRMMARNPIYRYVGDEIEDEEIPLFYIEQFY
jgi:hypothetical protein